MSCIICEGRAFVSSEKPYEIISCYHCGSKALFISSEDEQWFINSVVQQRSQKYFDFSENIK